MREVYSSDKWLGKFRAYTESYKTFLLRKLRWKVVIENFFGEWEYHNSFQGFLTKEEAEKKGNSYLDYLEEKEKRESNKEYL